MFKFLLGLIAAGLIALVATKPSEVDIEDLLHDRLKAEVEAGAGLDPEDPVQQLILGLCKSSGAGCINLIRQFIQVEYEGEIIYARVSASMPGGKSIKCIGAARQVFCPDFLQD
ncbi:hypothetical protein [Aliiroseovarius subalbicans]|uniref:hypothetical protein n=1 Tax=Aliiroseovarius subalbicans TaxID=2925840 RepID=UPI001F589F86|nr:hypothetical protein [Aliiroseovarius subalbicans]MCI2400297.1 hypothetical protein [Aliiroseovarius subalbicans]